MTRWLEKGIEQTLRAAMLPNTLSEQNATAVAGNEQ